MQFTTIIAVLGFALTATANLNTDNCRPGYVPGSMYDLRRTFSETVLTNIRICSKKRSVGLTSLPRRWLAEVEAAKIEAAKAE